LDTERHSILYRRGEYVMAKRVFDQFIDILLEIDNGIAKITMNRPEVLNATREITIDEMIEATRIVERDPEVGVLVLTGAGRAFCAGGDMDMMMRLNPKNGRFWNNRMMGLCMALRNLPFPTIAMVNGPCVGGGNEFQLYCDLVIASDKAFFGQTGARVGACPVVGGTQYATAFMGERKAKELIFLAERWSAQEAYERHMINKVVPHDQLEEETLKWCKKILTLNRDTLRICKLNIQFETDQLYASWSHGMEMLNSVIWGSEKANEGMTAFKQKREPNFQQFYSPEVYLPTYHEELIKDNARANNNYYEALVENPNQLSVESPKDLVKE
jgi:1,4-dihydroxy-2-naphthoyl-CoA synthase